MTASKHYEDSSDRHLFRLHEMDARPNHGFDLSAASPAGYAELTDDEKMSVAEFVEFLLGRREEMPADQRNAFRMRDHDNRPMTTELSAPADAPARYADLAEEGRFHTHEFIQFLVSIRGSDES